MALFFFIYNGHFVKYNKTSNMHSFLFWDAFPIIHSYTAQPKLLENPFLLQSARYLHLNYIDSICQFMQRSTKLLLIMIVNTKNLKIYFYGERSIIWFCLV